MRHSCVGCRADFQKIVARIMKLDYKIPEKLNLSFSVKHLLSRIFVKDPSKRISIAEIKQHSWYLHRLPYELQEGYKGFERCCTHIVAKCHPPSLGQSNRILSLEPRRSTAHKMVREHSSQQNACQSDLICVPVLCHASVASRPGNAENAEKPMGECGCGTELCRVKLLMVSCLR